MRYPVSTKDVPTYALLSREEQHRTYPVTVHAEQRHVEVHPCRKRKSASKMFHSTPRNAEDVWAEVYGKC